MVECRLGSRLMARYFAYFNSKSNKACEVRLINPILPQRKEKTKNMTDQGTI